MLKKHVLAGHVLHHQRASRRRYVYNALTTTSPTRHRQATCLQLVDHVSECVVAALKDGYRLVYRALIPKGRQMISNSGLFSVVDISSQVFVKVPTAVVHPMIASS